MNAHSLLSPSIHPANPAIGSRGDIHIHLPPGTTGPVPFVIGIHGGGWQNGDQNSYTYLCSKLHPLGIGLVLLSYRIAKEAPFPAAFDDLTHSLGWLKDHGQEHGLDITRSMLFGSSAGGHLVMLLASRVTAENLPSPKLLGVAQYCGIMDLVHQFAHDAKRQSTMTHQFLNTTPDEDPELYRLGSPIQHLHAGMPPIWMAHGTTDPTVPIEQSRAVVARLRELNHPILYLEAFGLGHTLREMTVDGVALEPLELLFEKEILRFIQRTLA